MAQRTLPKLNRIQTLVDATSFSFPIEDATGYSNPLPQARKIGLGRRALTGYMTSAKKTEGIGQFESSLERDYFALLEFDAKVIAWHPQPFTIPIPATQGRRGTRYSPDVAVEYATAPNGKNLDRVELVEVKYRDELRANWDYFKHRFRHGIRYAKREGWRFRILTEREIRTERLNNAKFFLPYRDRGTDEDDIYSIAMVLEKQGISTPNRVLDCPSLGYLTRGRLISILWHMVAKGLVVIDFDQPFGMNSPIQLSANAIY